MASYLIFLIINPPAEQYKFLSCKEMLRDSTTVFEVEIAEFITGIRWMFQLEFTCPTAAEGHGWRMKSR